MVVLAFLTDPAVVPRILAHLDLPTAPPADASARSVPSRCSLGGWINRPEEVSGRRGRDCAGSTVRPRIRPAEAPGAARAGGFRPGDAPETTVGQGGGQAGSARGWSAAPCTASEGAEERTKCLRS